MIPLPSRVGPHVVVLGRQGAGKGTQCARLAQVLAIPHVSTGDLFRAEMSAATPLGQRVGHYVDRGELVPDEIVLDLVASRLGNSEARGRGYLLDGFPRTLDQGQALFEVLGASAADIAIEIHVPAHVALPRLAARRVCEVCGVSTIAQAGDGQMGVCTACGGRISRRPDDTDEAIARRLAAYDAESAGLLVWFDSQGLLVTVDGTGHPDHVHRQVLEGARSRLAASHWPERATTPVSDLVGPNLADAG